MSFIRFFTIIFVLCIGISYCFSYAFAQESTVAPSSAPTAVISPTVVPTTASTVVPTVVPQQTFTQTPKTIFPQQIFLPKDPQPLDYTIAPGVYVTKTLSPSKTFYALAIGAGFICIGIFLRYVTFHFARRHLLSQIVLSLRSFFF